MKMKLLSKMDGSLLFPEQREFMVETNHKKFSITLAVNAATGKVKVVKSTYQLLTFERTAGKWEIKFVLPSSFLLYHEAVIVNKELQEIIQIIDYLDEHPDILAA